MKTCKGCGSFYNKKCGYCGYEDNNWKKKEGIEITTLKVEGSMNSVDVFYGDPQINNIFVEGSMQNTKITAKILNVVVSGSMNKVKINKKVKFTQIVSGSMNSIN